MVSDWSEGEEFRWASFSAFEFELLLRHEKADCYGSGAWPKASVVGIRNKVSS